MKNNEQNTRYPVAVTIAGSDSGGGAGIQADLRTFNAFGVFGASVVTAVTSQNPKRVARIDAIPAEAVACQLETVLESIEVKYAKTGMLLNAEIVKTVADLIRRHDLKTVVDPVMVSTSGSRLLEPTAIRAIREELIPAAQWITPNLPEMELLLERTLDGEAAWREAALEAHKRWNVAVVLKTGHAPSGKTVADVVCRAGRLYKLVSPRVVDQGQSHGTGCTLSAALAAALVMEMPWKNALCEAKAFVMGSLSESVEIGPGLQAMYPPVQDYLDKVRLEEIR